MPKSFYGHVANNWKNARAPEHLLIRQQRLYTWRRENVVTRLERPTRLDRARALGYKAKQGVIVVRTRVRRGGLRKSRFDGGRVPSKMGVNKITMKKSIQRIAEERVGKRYPNMQVLNSYWVGEDGRHKFYEIILVDSNHPSIRADKDLAWTANPGQNKRVTRGGTSAGKKGRGLRSKGKGHEKNRPSRRARGGLRN